jgi:type VI secretion system protein ImpA
VTPSPELESLAQPIAPEHPCGANLEDGPVLSTFNALRVFGQSTPWETPPEWPVVREQALTALHSSKDLRVLAHLGAAVVRTEGLGAFCDVLGVADLWLTQYWDTVYPGLEDEAVFRRNALSCFADRVAVIDAVRRAPLVSSRALGNFSLRDIELAQGQIQATESDTNPPQTAQLTAAFSSVPIEQLTSLEGQVAHGIEALKHVDGKMREAVGSDAAPDLQPLATLLQRTQKLLKEQRAAHPDAVPDQGNGAAGPDAGAGGALGPIRTRQDAIRALDAVASYFRQQEPSSPVPLFIDRAKRLVAKDFLEVLADVVPDALAQARQAGGIRDGAGGR